MLERFHIVRHNYGMSSSDRFMVASPLYFSAPIQRIFATLYLGGTGILWNQTDPLGSAVMGMAPSILHLSVYHAEKLLHECREIEPIEISSVRAVSIGASTVTEDLRRRMKEHLKAMLHINYGANEVFTVTFATPADLAAVPGSVGRPPSRVLVEVVDDTGRPVEAGEVGRVRVKSPAQVAGYYRQEDHERFRDGWFYPGDLARWSGDGQLVHCGRADQMMIMNGINIYPAEIERVLEQHSAVRDVVAFPLKHSQAQEVPACAVALHAGASASSSSLAAFARQRLGGRAPRLIAVVDTIPRNEQGKPQRRELLRLVEEQLAKRVRGEAVDRAAELGTKGVVLPPAEGPLRQLTRRYMVDFRLPQALQPILIDPWLLALNPELNIPALTAYATEGDLRGRHVRDWLARATLVARELLQAAGIPLFDAPHVVSCEPRGDDSATWRAAIAAAALDHVPMRAYEVAFSTALRTTSSMMALEPKVQSREALFTMLQREAVAPLKALASGGKSTMPLLRSAHSRGIPFRSLGGGIYQLGWGARGRLTDRSTTDRDSAVGLKLAQSKHLAAQVLHLAGLPAPTHYLVTTVDEAWRVADTLGWPVVVKPADLDRGEGVSVDVDAVSLERAFKDAHARSRTKQVLVERQIQGVCHRLFVASGQLLYAVRRLPMGVYGDGTLSVAALVEAELSVQSLKAPWRRSDLRAIDDLARASIAAAGLLESAVPSAGQFVPLRRIEATTWGGVDEDVTDTVHPENLRIAVAAAELFRLEVAGIDIISSDIAVPWHSNGAVINEVNFAPLLGGGEISRRHINEYLSRLIEGDGRIPVEVFIGGRAAWAAAIERSIRLGSEATNIFVTSADRTIDGAGHEVPMPFVSLRSRTRALILSRHVHGLLLVVQDDELLEGALPLECIDRLVEVDGDLRQRRSPSLPLHHRDFRMLCELLAERVRSSQH
jgi:D-alanine-D-alanine ligase-like ATP-grasp enzyme